MSTALQPAPKQEAVTVRSLVAKPEYQNRFKELLGQKSQQFCTSLINVGNSMQDVEPYSVIQSAMIAAALDLPIDKNLGFAWIVAYKKGGVKYAQFQMGYKGYIQLALRSNQYKHMNARAINDEAFTGFADVGEPIIDWSKVDEDKPVAGYVFSFQLLTGFSKVAYWPKRRVEAHASRYSQSYKGGFESPWKTHFDEMALKSVIKNELARWGILSIQMQEAIAKDQAVIDVEGSVTYPDNEATPQFTAPKKLLKSAKHDPTPEQQGTQVNADGSDFQPTPDCKGGPTATTTAAGNGRSASDQPETTPQANLEHLMTTSHVPFDDFRDFVRVKGLAKDTDSWTCYAEVPSAVIDKLTPKMQADCIRTYGKVQQQAA